MRCDVLLGAVALAVAGLIGCGGDESGPRGVIANGGSGMAGGPSSRPALRTVLYLPSYRGNLSTWTKQLTFANISYLNLSFIQVDASGTVSYPDAALPGFVNAAHQAGVKVCMALGGANTIDDGGVFANLLKDANRAQLVANLFAFLKANELDCLDIDLEGNGVNEFYEAFVTELQAKLKPEGLELTAAVASWFGERITARALASFDFVNIMAYDLYQSRQTPMQTSSIDAATREMDSWVARGLARDRAVYGVPFYGFEWPSAGGEPQVLGYGELLRRDRAAATQDQLAGAGTIVYLNSRNTIQAKAKLAQTYGGIMAWEAGQDASGDDSLLRAIREAVP